MIVLTTNVLGKRPIQQARLVVDHPQVDHPTAVDHQTAADHPPAECLPEDHLPVDSHLKVKTRPILKPQ